MILSPESNPASKGFRSGFTLLELLVVISVMALMMGFIGFSLLGGGGSSLDAAQREMVSLVQQTRMQATLSGRETRLIVHNDPAVPEKFHRYLEIVVEDANLTGGWRPLGQGTLLPDGAYIVPGKKRFGISVETSSNVTWPSEAYSIWSGDGSEDFLLGSIRKGVLAELRAFAKARNLPGGEKDTLVAFSTFVEFIASGVHGKRNHHWERQSDVIFYSDIPYTQTFQMEKGLDRALYPLFKDTEVTENWILQRAGFPFNASSIDKESPITSVLADRIYEIFEDDFVSFGYAKEDW